MTLALKTYPSNLITTLTIIPSLIRLPQDSLEKLLQQPVTSWTMPVLNKSEVNRSKQSTGQDRNQPRNGNHSNSNNVKHERNKGKIFHNRNFFNLCFKKVSKVSKYLNTNFFHLSRNTFICSSFIENGHQRNEI